MGPRESDEDVSLAPRSREWPRRCRPAAVMGGFDPNATIKQQLKHLDLAGYYDRGSSSDDSVTTPGLTPANLAARKGFTDVLRLLHRHGANVDIPSWNEGYRLIHEAVAGGEDGVVKFSLK